jgi:hypothetical protein
MKFTPEEIKKRINSVETWKNLKPETKEELRTSWKELDTICKKEHGHPRLMKSKLNQDIYLKACVFYETEHVDYQGPFLRLVHGVENQLAQRETEYAIHAHGFQDLVYETNSDYHFIELASRDDWEDDTVTLSLTAQHRLDRYSPNKNSYIENFLLQHHRMQKTKNEGKIEDLVNLSNQVLHIKPDEKTEEKILELRVTSHQLAEKIKEYFD